MKNTYVLFIIFCSAMTTSVLAMDDTSGKKNIKKRKDTIQQLDTSTDPKEALNKQLLDSCSVDWKDSDEATNLRRLASIKELVEAGACINAVNSNTHTPLHLAVQESNFGFSLAEYLIEKKANVNAATKEWGITPLHSVAFLGDFKMAQLLVEHRADVHAKDMTHRTPIKWATEKKHFALAKYLEQAKSINSNKDAEKPDEKSQSKETEKS